MSRDEDEPSPWRSWRKFRIHAIQTCEVILSRSLEVWEREMFLFPKACRVCYLAKGDGMIVCEQCSCVAYCSQQHRLESFYHSFWTPVSRPVGR